MEDEYGEDEPEYDEQEGDDAGSEAGSGVKKSRITVKQAVFFVSRTTVNESVCFECRNVASSPKVLSAPVEGGSRVGCDHRNTVTEPEIHQKQGSSGRVS